MSNELLGWAALVFFLMGCSYSIVKRVKKVRKIFNMPMKIVLNYHCAFCIIATILALIHSRKHLLHNIEISTGYISLILMILTSIIGIIMKRCNKLYRSHRDLFLYTHIFFSIILLGTLLLHVLRYFLLM